jgi:hypothetical protein
VALIDTRLHGLSSPYYLNSLALAALGEYRQQNDSSTAGDVVGDPRLLATKEEPEFAQLSIELPRDRFPEVDAFLGKEIDVPLHLAELIVAE